MCKATPQPSGTPGMGGTLVGLPGSCGILAPRASAGAGRLRTLITTSPSTAHGRSAASTIDFQR